MSDSTLHIGALASNNIVNDAGKYDECKEKVKDLTKEIQTRKDIFEKMAEPLVYVCDCYQKFNVVTGMPKRYAERYIQSYDRFLCRKGEQG
mgnify:CR=1 FL=1